MTATPTVAERLERLEDGLIALTLFVTDNHPDRLTRSLAAGASGSSLLELVHVITDERGS